MTIKTQAYLQGYLHEKTAAVGLDPNKPIPPNIQKHMGPWTGDTFQQEQRADAIAAGNQWPTMTGVIPPGRRPDGSLNWPWAKQWGNPKPLIKGIRDTAAGAVADIGRAWAGPRAVDHIENMKDYSVVGDIRDVVKHIRKDPVYNTKQMLKDIAFGPGGAYNLAALALPATWASTLAKGKMTVRGTKTRALRPAEIKLKKDHDAYLAKRNADPVHGRDAILARMKKRDAEMGDDFDGDGWQRAMKATPPAALPAPGTLVPATWPGKKPFGHPDWLKEDTGPRMGGHDPADVVRARENMDRLKRLLDDPDFADKLWSNIDDSAAARAAKNKGPLADTPPGSPIGPQPRDVIPEGLDKDPSQVPTSWYDPKVDKRAPGKRRPRKSSAQEIYDAGLRPTWNPPGKGTTLQLSTPNRNPTKTEIDISYGRMRDKKVDMDNWWKEPVANASDLKEWQANGYLVERKKFLDDFVEKPLHDMAAELLDADVDLLWSNYYGEGPKGVYYVDAKGGRRFRRHRDDLSTGPETSLISHVEDFVGDPEGLIQSLFGPDIAGPAYTPTRHSYTIDNPLTGWN